jgi:hypothetical protein
MCTSPDFAIIGAQKSATTFFQNALQSHPEVFIPDGELATFEDPQYKNYDRNEFAANFAPGESATAVGLKRPSYLHEPAVAPRLANHLPGLKLVVSLRDPIERAISAYFHQMRQGFAPVRDVNAGLRAILRGEWKEEYPRTTQIIDYGSYHSQLSRYLQHYDPDRFFVTTYQSIKETPEVMLRALCGFLGIEGNHDLTGAVAGRSNEGVYSKARIQLIRLTNPLRFEYFYGGQRLRPRDKVGRLGHAFMRLVRGIDRRIVQPLVSNELPTLRPDVQAELAECYRPDAAKLKDDFDLDIDHWAVFSA